MNDKISITKKTMIKLITQVENKHGNREQIILMIQAQLDWYINNFERSLRNLTDIVEFLDLIEALDEGNSKFLKKGG